MLDFLKAIDNERFNVQDKEDFQVASAGIVCNIIGNDEVLKSKFCSLFKSEFNISHDELEQVKNSVSKNAAIDQNVKAIKEQLNNNPYQIANFLKILNKFIIVDHCKDSDYCQFDDIREKLLA